MPPCSREGFIQGLSAPTTFYNPIMDVECVVYGDDFTFLGEEVHLKDLAVVMQSWFEVRVRGILGPEKDDF